MAERTVKYSFWKPQGRPRESRELAVSRVLISEVVVDLYRRKAVMLAGMGMPAQPVSLGQIFLELKSEGADAP